jgi:hypothetical protein
MVHTNWLVSEKQEPGGQWTFLPFTFSGLESGFEYKYRIIDPRSLMADSSATGSTGGSLHSLVQVAGLSAHDCNLHHGPLFFF